MNINEINSILRILQLIPLMFVFVPIFNSYLHKKNTINGLRKTRVVLIILLFALIFSNCYFCTFSMFKLSRAEPENQPIVIIEKIVNIFAYWLLYFLFNHARKPKNKKG